MLCSQREIESCVKEQVRSETESIIRNKVEMTQSVPTMSVIYLLWISLNQVIAMT